MRAAPIRRLVSFGIGEAWYAVDVAHVERVLRYEGVVPVPNMPPWMAGILEYQGRVVPVLDLRRRLGLSAEGVGAGGRLLLLALGDDVVAAAVDRVVDVRPVTDGEIAPPPPLVRGAAGAFLCGVLRRDDTMVFVLDAARLLSAESGMRLDAGADAPPTVSAVLGATLAAAAAVPACGAKADD